MSSRSVKEKIDNMFGNLVGLAEIGSAVPSYLGSLNGDGLKHPDRTFLQKLFSTNGNLYSAYLGYRNGDFFQIIHAAGNHAIAAAHEAPDSTAFIIRSISGQRDERRQQWTFINADGKTIGVRIEKEPAFDPRTRPWYEGALANPEGYLGDPYIFNSLKAPGLTAAHRMADQDAVLGIDLTLSGLQDFVSNLEISGNAFLLIYGKDGHLLASSAKAAATLGENPTQLEPPGPRAAALLDSVPRNTPTDADRAVFRSDAALFYTVNAWAGAGSARFTILTAAPLNDFIGPLRKLRGDVLLLSLLTLALFMPAAFFLSRKLSTMLIVIAEDAKRISRFDFTNCDNGHSIVQEFNQLSDAFGVMKGTISSRTKVLNDTHQKLEKLVNLGIGLSSLRDIDELCEKILRGAMDLTLAEAGTLYLRGTKENRDKLEFKIVINDKLVGFDQGGTTGKPITLPPVALFNADGSPNGHNIVTDAFHKDKIINIPNASEYEGHDLSGTRRFDQFTGYHSVSFLTVPLKPFGREVIGALQLINTRDAKTGEVIPFNKDIEGLIQALSAQAATALDNQKLIHDLEQLFESMINAIADAIDAKSPYTGGHNKRVPVIASMLAAEAQKATYGPFADWTLDMHNGDRQFHIATMLHDCGKITTPEYVVDKATKLETIYNRIHEIRTRFEVLLRDAMIEHREMLLAGHGKAEADAWLEGKKSELRADFAFLAESNLGSEFMAENRIERLKAIADRRWIRYFDDTLGLSKEELALVPPGERKDIPAQEFLLADKARHRVPQDNGWRDRYELRRFRIDIPELKYNRGEVYNLSIARGTLTAEERFKINEHSMQTIEMLSKLCENSEDLQDVVQWAGSHHETLKGTGYPRKLAAAELSVEARILTIADIFEALTASDRPYKPSKTLSEAVRILYNFKKDGHIDPDLFDLFLTSGIYREYGDKYLTPGQIDDVDIAAYVGKTG